MPWPDPPAYMASWSRWLAGIAVAILCHQSTEAAAVQPKRRPVTVVPLSSEQLGDHIDGWTTDVAVLFCTPSVPTCKLFAAIWEDVARHHAKAKTKNLMIAQYDCERDYIAEELCYYLGIDRYPTIMFFGYGSYYQSDPLSSALSGKRKRIDRTVTYEGELGDAQQVSDWTDMMHWASGWHRMTKRFTSFFFSPWKDADLLETSLKRVKEENYILREELRLSRGSADSGKSGGGGGGSADKSSPSSSGSSFFGWGKGNKAASGSGSGAGSGGGSGKKGGGGVGRVGDRDGKSIDAAFVEAVDELLGPVKGSGDPWVELPKLEGKAAEALQLCIRDFAGDYCDEIKKKGDEPWCDILPKCVDKDFKPKECQPAKCPFKKEEGRTRMENCLRENVIDLYLEMVGGTPTKASTTTATTTKKDKK